MRSHVALRVMINPFCALLLAFLALGCPPGQPEYSMRYSIVKLDTRSGAAMDINGSCEVVGYLRFSDTTSGFLWLPDEGIKMRDLGANTTGAYGINDYGEVTGSKRVDYYRHAYRWTEAEGVRDIGPLGAHSGIGWGISNMGTVAGDAGDADGYWRAFNWHEDTGLYFIAQAQAGSHAYGINNLDVSVGALIAGGGGSLTVEVRSWTPDGIDRGLQNVLGNGFSQANAINDLNKAVGAFEDKNDWWTACSWTASGGMKNLGGLGYQVRSFDVLFSSEANDINWLGDIVGQATTENGVRHAVLWEDDICYDLNYLAPIASSSEWVYLSEANAINNKGCIVGRGRLLVGDIGENVPYILVPVIPKELILSPSTVNGGGTVQCTVVFSGKLPIEMRVKIDLSEVSAMVGPSVSVVDVPKGEDRGQFSLHTNQMLRTRTGDVAVEVGGYRLTAPLTVVGIEVPIG